MLNHFSKRLVLLLMMMFSVTCVAEDSVDTLGLCLANSTTGKDRINLARWVFAGVASHPEVSNISAVTPEKLEEINKTVAALFTRLLTIDCRNEVKAAYDLGNRSSIQSAFGTLGKLAMQELVNNPSVNAEFSTGLNKYLDMKKLMDVIQ